MYAFCCKLRLSRKISYMHLLIYRLIWKKNHGNTLAPAMLSTQSINATPSFR
jgi:hypothetical protein